MEDEEALRQAVEAQARARIAGDIATFSSYVTPQALLRLHRQGATLRAGPSVRRYEILDITVESGVGSSDVRYIGGGSYVLRTRWERPEGLWKAIMIEMPPESIRGPWWRRLLRLERAGTPSVPERRDLS